MKSERDSTCWITTVTADSVVWMEEAVENMGGGDKTKGPVVGDKIGVAAKATSQGGSLADNQLRLYVMGC